MLMPLKPVPREKIPWFPSIDEGKCNGCQVCFRFCQHGVYAWDEKADLVKVQSPLNCVVGCNGCESLCPEKAISFPDLETIQGLIRKLREG
jgi:NAD-dependent dihydropyrimidine dehydrogenase PreA subunit